MDLESKIIMRAEVTDASMPDSQVLDALTREGDPPTWLDSADAGQPCEELLRGKKIEAKICARGARNRPLTKKQKQAHRVKSRRRSRVEPVFGFMTGSMHAMCQRCVGRVRNRANIILSHLVYNMARVEQIVRLELLGRRQPTLIENPRIKNRGSESPLQTVARGELRKVRKLFQSYRSLKLRKA